jgi:hypothetical protein
MHSKVVDPQKHLAACVAQMQSLPRLWPHVHSKVVDPHERLAAHFADMRPLP